MTTTFAHLGLPAELVRALAGAGITEPFPVQATTIPDGLAGRDVSARAPTGSGKTLAFGLPLLMRVDRADRHRPRALILAPTRELAEQIKQELAPLAKATHRSVFAIYGGVGYGPQKSALRRGIDVLVATPGRLEDLLEQGSLNLSQVHIVVVDEADRMADMGFLPAVRRILDKTSPKRQTLLFSATLDGDVAVLRREYQRDPVEHLAGSIEHETIDARHHFWLIQQQGRVGHTADIINATGRSIVFTRTRHRATRLARQLVQLGITAVPIHGGRSQSQRHRALREFSAGRAAALIATDVAARGIHIDSVASVVHFDPPADHKDYLHRSGRTARAGAAGTVVTLVTSEQRRTITTMQQRLALHAPIESPNLQSLHNGGHQLGDAPYRRNGHGNSASSVLRDAPVARPTRDGRSLYVANLPWQATNDEVSTLFAHHGEVHRATVITDRRTGRSKGFGFVEMAKADAQNAVDALHGSSFCGRDLTVSLARPRRRG